MGLGLIIIGLGLGVLAAGMTLAWGAGLLWALAAYMTVGTLGIFAAAGLVLSREALVGAGQAASAKGPAHSGSLPAAPSRTDL